MFSVSSFFDLPTLTRFRWIQGVGAASLFFVMFTRWTTDLMPGQSFYSLEVAATATLALFAGFAHRIAWIRKHAHAALFCSQLPTLAHFLYLHYDVGVAAGMLMSLGTCIVFVGMLMEQANWRMRYVLLWTAGTMAVVWVAPTPEVSPLVICIVFAIIALLVCVIGRGFHAARQELAHAAQLLDESQSFSGVGAWQKDYRTGEITWTKTTYDILELPKDHTADLNLLPFLVGKEEDSALRAGTDRMLETGEPYDVVDRIRTAKGREIWVHCQAKLFMENGQPVRAMGVFNDITDQVEHERELTEAKEAAEAAVVARGQFLANMSHEIRTPMNGVIGMTSMLSQMDLDEQSRAHVEVIRASGESLLAIINDILDFSKLDAGKLDLEVLPFSLSRLIDSALEMVAPVASGKGLTLNSAVPEVSHLEYLGDENRLRQILVNLLSNAVKFTERGSVTLAVDAPGNAAEGELVFRIIDTGVGIAKEQQASLFDAFTQADASTTREFGGTGLGLAICRQLAVAMQGEIDVDSDLGAGATFTFRVKLLTKPCLASAAKPVAEAAVPAAASTEDFRILLAEDNPVNQKVAVMMLNKLGYNVDVADNGREAVEAVEQLDYDVIFMDLQMPEIDGIEATRLIRANEQIRQPCIIALTANAMAEDRQQCFAAGMNDFVAKPMRLRDLQSALAGVSPS